MCFCESGLIVCLGNTNGVSIICTFAGEHESKAFEERPENNYHKMNAAVATIAAEAC